MNEVPRANLLAFDIKTGRLKDAFVADNSAQVLALEVAPDGSTLYAGGDSTSIDGVTPCRVAALHPVTGAVNRGFKAGTSYPVQALVATPGALSLGGAFHAAGPGGDQPRARLAAFEPANGALLQWAPSPREGESSRWPTSPVPTGTQSAGRSTS